MAYKSGMNYKGKNIEFKLFDENGNELVKDKLYVPKYKENCNECGSKIINNGCSECGKCE